VTRLDAKGSRYGSPCKPDLASRPIQYFSKAWKSNLALDAHTPHLQFQIIAIHWLEHPTSLARAMLD